MGAPHSGRRRIAENWCPSHPGRAVRCRQVQVVGAAGFVAPFRRRRRAERASPSPGWSRGGRGQHPAGARSTQVASCLERPDQIGQIAVRRGLKLGCDSVGSTRCAAVVPRRSSRTGVVAVAGARQSTLPVPTRQGPAPELRCGAFVSGLFRRRPTLPGGFPQVPSALAGLTSVFGMGTGVTPPLWPPETVLNKALVAVRRPPL